MRKILAAAATAILLSTVSLASSTKSLFYDFASQPSGVSALGNYDTTTFENGVMTAEGAQSKTDPQFYITLPDGGINADDYDTLTMRIKHDLLPRPDTTGLISQVFFQGKAADDSTIGLAESNSAKCGINLSTNDEYVIYTFDLGAVSTWPGSKITKLRVDPVNAGGTFSLDYIMLSKASGDKLFTFDKSDEGWGYGNMDKPVVKDGCLTGTTGADKTNSLINHSFPLTPGADYQHVYVSMRLDNAVSGNMLWYTDLFDANGGSLKPNWWTAYNGYNYATTTVSAADNGKFKLYDLNLEPYAAYKDGFFKSVSFNFYNKTGSADFYIDYILMKSASSEYDYNFRLDGNTNGLTFFKKNGGTWEIKDGKAHFTHPGGKTWGDPQIQLSGISMNADDYVGVEVIYRHDIGENGTISGNKMQLYYSGTNAAGESFSLSEGNSKSTAIPSASSGEGTEYLYIDLTNATNWSGSTINYWRLDVTNTYEDMDIISFRFVPNPEKGKTGAFEHPETFALTYDFDEDFGDSARGTIKVDFDGEKASFAKTVRLNWASGSAAAGYTDLADYTALFTVNGETAEKGIVIKKSLLIPKEATALVAHITDSSKIFDLAFDIPGDKKVTSNAAKLYSAAFITDTHFGYNTSASKPTLANHDKALAFINEYGVDFVGVPGDFTQYYGRNENIDKTGPIEEWDIAAQWFKQFDAPVYVTNGNHDVPQKNIIESATYGEPAGYTFNTDKIGYYEKFLKSWLEYCNANTYENAVECPCDGSNWYDTEVAGTHLIALCVPRWDAELGDQPCSFGDEQLAWLDERLFEDERSGKPIFILAHVASNYTVSYFGRDTGDWWNHQISDNDKLVAVLNKHPSVVYVSGHSHFTLNTEADNAVDGKGVTPSFLHAGGIHDSESFDSATDTYRTDYSGSEGVIAEVYADRIVIRSRDFMNGKWISAGYAELTYASLFSSDADAVTARKTADGDKVTLKAYTSVSDALTYEWYVNGEKKATGATYTLDASFDGYVALRAVNEDGGYASVLYESLDEIADDTAPEGPVMLNLTSIRVNEPKGLRFAAYVTEEMRAESESYGFLVARETAELAADPTRLVFDASNSASAKNTYGVKYTSGEAYNKTSGTDILYAEEGSDFGLSDVEAYFFTGIMTGIPEKYYRTNLVARPYMVADGVTLYGACCSRSLYDTAKAIREGGYQGLNDDEIAYVDSILKSAPDELPIDISELYE